MFAFVMAPVKMEKDPRHLWWVDSLLEKGIDVAFVENLSHKPYVFQSKRNRFLDYNLSSRVLENGVKGISIEVGQEFSINQFREASASVNSESLAKIINEILDNSTSLPSLYSVQQILRISAGLTLVEKPETNTLYIANDLVCAAAAILSLDSESNLIVYDAQEFFTDMWDVSTVGSLTSIERNLWIELETIVCKNVERVITISPGAAKLYLERHEISPRVIPNYLPLSSGKQNREPVKGIKLVFMGNFAPHRGIDRLVKEWSEAETQGLALDMYVPATSDLSEIRKIIKKHKPSNFRLMNGVPESMMLETLSNYDVGIIPYDYPYPYDQCSPNKFGQYLSQGLCVISNDQSFLQAEIETYSLGTVFNWDEFGSFQTALESIKIVENVREIKRNVEGAFRDELNWDSYFEDFWNDLMRVICGQNDLLQAVEPEVRIDSQVKFRRSEISNFKKSIYWSLDLLDVYGDSGRSRFFRSLLNSRVFKVLISRFSRRMI